MSGTQPFKTYLTHAFHNVYNYIGLGLFGGLFLIDGMASRLHFNSGWLLVGAALELFYLYMLTTNARWQRHVDSLYEDQKDFEIRELRNALWPYIDADIRQRYMELEQLAGRIGGESLSKMQSGALLPAQIQDPMLKDNLRKVVTLLASYLKLGASVTRYHSYLTSVDTAKITSDIERLQGQTEASSEKVRAVKAKNIDVLQRRLEKVEKAGSNVQYLEAQMETIEDTMRLVVDQAITLSDPKGMGVQIDSLLDTLRDTDLISAEMESFDELAEGYDPVIGQPRPRQKQ